MAKEGRMPANVFWVPVLWTIFVASAVMWAIMGLIAGDNNKTRDAINGPLRFRESLFRHIVGTGGERETDLVSASIAAYLRDHRDDLDHLLKRERLASLSLTKDQRVMLHMQSPDRFPEQLLLMTNEPMWHALRDDAAALAELKQLLSGEISVVPDVAYDTRSAIPKDWLIAWPLVCQMLAFLIYLVNWGGTDRQGNYVWYNDYYWYDVGLPAHVCMVLLLPGAAPVLVPMALVAIGKRARKQWRDGSSMSRQGVGLPPIHQNTNGTAFLKKLQTRVERRMGSGG